MPNDKNIDRRTYQVWALLHNERGEQAWQAVTKPYERRSVAVSIANSMWLETRIEQTQEGQD